MPHNSAEPAPIQRVLVTGATGYIGGRLAPRLLEAGFRVRCLARSAEKLSARPWASHEGVEIFEGDVSNEADLISALQDCDAAYYLIHSMEAAVGDYRSRDLALAETFGRACAEAGVKRIVYLGGLGETGQGLSKHLTSRREVETALESSGVPVTVLRAAMIIGSGSASFEILRYLVERLPIMVTPKWVNTESQPIAIRDVLFYAVEVLSVTETRGKTLDIGGPDILSYAELMQGPSRKGCETEWSAATMTQPASCPTNALQSGRPSLRPWQRCRQGQLKPRGRTPALCREIPLGPAAPST